MDDLKAAGSGSSSKRFINCFSRTLNLNTVVSGPGKMSFFFLNVEQAEDSTIRADADDKLKILDEYNI